MLRAPRRIGEAARSRNCGEVSVCDSDFWKSHNCSDVVWTAVGGIGESRCLRHRACPGGSTASALLTPEGSRSSAKAVNPPGQARWRELRDTSTDYEFNRYQQIPISDAIVVAGVLKLVRVCSGAGMVSSKTGCTLSCMKLFVLRYPKRVSAATSSSFRLAVQI